MYPCECVCACLRAHVSPHLNELGFESWSCGGARCVLTPKNSRAGFVYVTNGRKVNEEAW